MSGFVGRLGTKINYAVGKAEKTELDEATRLKMSRFEHFKEDTEFLKAKLDETMLHVSSLSKQEKLAEAFAQMSARVEKSKLKTDAANLAECLRFLGKNERDNTPCLTENVSLPMGHFLQNECVQYKRMKTDLENARVEMDGHRSKRQRSSSPDAAVKEQLTKQEEESKTTFEEKLQEINDAMDKLDSHMENQMEKLIAYGNQMLKFHNEAAAKIQEYLNS